MEIEQTSVGAHAEANPSLILKGSSTLLRNHDFGWAFELRENRLEKDEAGVTNVASVHTCVIEGVEERGGVEVSG
jgi:hypothetical protein